MGVEGWKIITMAESENKEQSNRPEDSDFKQQRLKAWQPILTPSWVIGTFLSVGVVFLAIGIAVLVSSNNVAEQSSGDYTNIAAIDPSSCVQGAQSDGESCLKTVSMTLDSDMNAPVYMYYELGNFYQNHRRYVKSRNDNQLMDSSKATTIEQCSPIDKANGAAVSGVPVYPCGLIAWSVFNDTYYAQDTQGNKYQNRLLVLDAGTTTCAGTDTTCKLVTTTSNGIAWSSDRDDKFQKLTTCPGNNLLSTSASPAITMPYYTYKYYMCSDGSPMCSIKGTSEGSTLCADMTPPTSSAVGQTGMASISTCSQEKRCGDVSNEEFIVWMRTSGLPTFRKLHRVINTDLKKGETIQITVNDVFPVSSFSGSKKIVFSTTAWIGGKNTFLGAAYITVACICILLGIGFGVKEVVSPRKMTES